VAAALSYGFGSVWGRRFKRLNLAPLQTAFGQVCSATLMMIPLSLVIDRPWQQPLPPQEALQAVAALGVFCTWLCLYSLFPHSRQCRCHGCVACHISDPAQRDHSRLCGAGRKPDHDAMDRHGADRLWSGCGGRAVYALFPSRSKCGTKAVTTCS